MKTFSVCPDSFSWPLPARKVVLNEIQGSPITMSQYHTTRLLHTHALPVPPFVTAILRLWKSNSSIQSDRILFHLPKQETQSKPCYL
ncbi:hypothetical protein FKM82_004978 [Ascaphus truei]